MSEIKILTTRKNDLITLKFLLPSPVTNTEEGSITATINRIQIHLNNELFYDIFTNESLAKNPYFSVKFVAYKNDKFTISFTDSLDQKRTKIGTVD